MWKTFVIKHMAPVVLRMDHAHTHVDGKDRGQPQGLRDHLARFPAGVTAPYAQTKLEGLVWAGLGLSPGITALQAFVDEFPKGVHAEPAKARCRRLQSSDAMLAIIAVSCSRFVRMEQASCSR